MAFNIKPKRNRADTEENISLQKILDSFSGPMMFFLVIVAVIFVMSVFSEFRIYRSKETHTIPMKRSSEP